MHVDVGRLSKLKLRAGDVVADRYTIRERIGRGGAGVVYRVHDAETGLDVALKTPLPVIARQEKPRQRFSREMRLVARLKHEHTTSLFDVGLTGGGLPWFTMELVNGRRLRDVLRQGALGPQRAIRAGIQILGSLEEAHGYGIVHRDLKPENVFLCDGDFVKVADFGLAVCMVEAENVTLMGEAVGTLPYMAPEYLFDGEVSPQMDLYTVGLLIYEMILGESPFARMNVHKIQQAKQREVPLTREILGTLGPAAPIVARAVQNDPGRRYDDAASMASHLGEVLGTQEVPRAPSSWQNPALIRQTGGDVTHPPRRHTTDQTVPMQRSEVFPVEVTPSRLHKVPSPPPSS